MIKQSQINEREFQASHHQSMTDRIEHAYPSVKPHVERINEWHVDKHLTSSEHSSDTWTNTSRRAITRVNRGQKTPHVERTHERVNRDSGPCPSVHVTYVRVHHESVTDLLRAGAVAGGVSIVDSCPADFNTSSHHHQASNGGGSGGGGGGGGVALSSQAHASAAAARVPEVSLRGATHARVTDEEAAFGLIIAAEVGLLWCALTRRF